jgi:hypothetical protein
MKLATLFASLFIGSALACSCAEMDDARAWLKDADMVFIGTPSSNSRVIGTMDGQPLQNTTFRVQRVYKNVSSPIVSIRTEKFDGANCGVNFRRNLGRFLVFATKVGHKFYSSGCDVSDIRRRSVEMDRFIRDLERASN